jgi:hypothetical protein
VSGIAALELSPPASPVEDPEHVLLRAFLELAEGGLGRRAPFAQYAADPVGFFRHVLGIEPWGRHPGLPPEEASQIDILEAVRDHDMVAVRSGHKVSKSCSAAGLAIWWPLTRPHGRVILTAPAGHQVESILWTEIRDLVGHTHPGQRGKILPPLPGTVHIDPHNGYELGPGWGVWGLTTDKPERMSGKSGTDQLFIVDEASGYPEEIFTSVFGNMAGGGKVVLFSNPTRPSGTFFEAFHGKRHAWTTLHVSSLNTPNFHGGHVPGLAAPKWHEDLAIPLWGGPGSPLYDVRVLGNFPSQGENVVVPMALVAAARGRWATTPDEGDLEIGVDVAREGDDESILAPLRGKKLLELEAVKLDRSVNAMPPGPQVAEAAVRMARRLRRGSSAVGAANAPLHYGDQVTVDGQVGALRRLAQERQPGVWWEIVTESGVLFRRQEQLVRFAQPDQQRPRIKVDCIGVGTAVLDHLLLNYRDEFEILGVNTACAADASLIVAPATSISPAKTAADEYLNLRAQIAFGVTTWLREGGAIPEDGKLEAELVAPTFSFKQRGKIQVEDKREVKKRLRRSPDRADALALAVYNPPRQAPAPRGMGTESLGFF